MTKIYLLFKTETYYPCGGFDDLIFMTLDEKIAIDSLEKLRKNVDDYDVLELLSIEGLIIKKYNTSTCKWINWEIDEDNKKYYKIYKEKKMKSFNDKAGIWGILPKQAWKKLEEMD